MCLTTFCYGFWLKQVTKALLAAVASDEFLLIKCGLIMYNKLIEVRAGHLSLVCARREAIAFMLGVTRNFRWIGASHARFSGRIHHYNTSEKEKS